MTEPCPRLALLAREELAQLGAAGEELGAHRVERVEALLRRRSRPLREGGPRRQHRTVDCRGVADRVVVDHVGEVGRVDVRRRPAPGETTFAHLAISPRLSGAKEAPDATVRTAADRVSMRRFMTM
jgi:hypothetical protein